MSEPDEERIEFWWDALDLCQLDAEEREMPCCYAAGEPEFDVQATADGPGGEGQS